MERDKHIKLKANCPDDIKRAKLMALDDSPYYFDDEFELVPEEESMMCTNLGEVLNGAKPLGNLLSMAEPIYENGDFKGLVGKHRVRDEFEAMRASEFYFNCEADRARNAASKTNKPE